MMPLLFMLFYIFRNNLDLSNLVLYFLKILSYHKKDIFTVNSYALKW